MLSVFVECVVEGSGEAGGIADHEHLGVFGGEGSENCVEDELADAGCFVDDDEDVLAVETLESLGGVGGESVCEAFVGEDESGLGDFPADEVFVALVDCADFAPQELFDLSFGGCGGEDDGIVVRHEPPQSCEGGGKGFARSVARSHGDEVVVSDGVKDVDLFLPRLSSEVVFYEPFGVDSGALALVVGEVVYG